MTRYYIAECQDCSPTLPMPFLERDKRDEWASFHSDVLRHHVLVCTQDMTTSEESIYRRCFECGKEWTAEALVAAHNEILDEIGKPGAADHVTDPATVPCCPDCIHDW